MGRIALSTLANKHPLNIITRSMDRRLQLPQCSRGMYLFVVAIFFTSFLLRSEGSSDPSISGKLSRTKPCPDGMICPTEISSHPNTDYSDPDKPETKSADKKKDLETLKKLIGNDRSRTKSSAESDSRWQLVDDHGAFINPDVPDAHKLPESPMGPVGKSLVNSWVKSNAKEDPYDPRSPLVRCDFLPLDFLECEQPVDLQGNKTAFDVLGYGCYRYGGQKSEDVQNTSVFCSVLPGIECHGERKFLRSGFPCLKFTGHYFLSTLLFSILMGFLGLDRFCLGHTCLATVKLVSIGGLGVWWFVDVILLVTGNLMPEDGSNWMPYQ